MEVAIRELKAKLSHYLRLAAAGEHLVVTDRGRPVASLGPPVAGVDLETGVEEGWIRPASSPGALRPVRRARSVRPVLETLSEDRIG